MLGVPAPIGWLFAVLALGRLMLGVPALKGHAGGSSSWGTDAGVLSLGGLMLGYVVMSTTYLVFLFEGSRHGPKSSSRPDFKRKREKGKE